jgi:hypothetical protein
MRVLGEPAVSSESEPDRRMIAIAVLFVRLLCDCFKPLPQHQDLGF